MFDCLALNNNIVERIRKKNSNIEREREREREREGEGGSSRERERVGEDVCARKKKTDKNPKKKLYYVPDIEWRMAVLVVVINKMVFRL